MSEHYNISFYKDLHVATLTGARAVARIMMPLLPRSNSVVDFGAGTGTWLCAFGELGFTKLRALEGGWVKGVPKAVPEDAFQYCNLSNPPDLSETYDLAISLEVGEHLPGKSSEGFVAAICRASPFVLFSAAIPGQGGVNHLNEQWPEYWIDLFAKNGYECTDAVRPIIWNNGKIAVHYRQNIFIFHKLPLAGRSTESPKMMTPSMVHPEIARQWPPTIRSSWRILMASIQRRLRKEASRFGDNRKGY